MAKILKSPGNTIALPADMLDLLRLKEGEEVRVTVDGQKLRIVRIEEFVKLRGVLCGDEGFDEAIELLDQTWQSWKSPTSV